MNSCRQFVPTHIFPLLLLIPPKATQTLLFAYSSPSFSSFLFNSLSSSDICLLRSPPSFSSSSLSSSLLQFHFVYMSNWIHTKTNVTEQAHSAPSVRWRAPWQTSLCRKPVLQGLEAETLLTQLCPLNSRIGNIYPGVLVGTGESVYMVAEQIHNLARFFFFTRSSIIVLEFWLIPVGGVVGLKHLGWCIGLEWAVFWFCWISSIISYLPKYKVSKLSQNVKNGQS